MAHTVKAYISPVGVGRTSDRASAGYWRGQTYIGTDVVSADEAARILADVEPAHTHQCDLHGAAGLMRYPGHTLVAGYPDMAALAESLAAFVNAPVAA